MPYIAWGLTDSRNAFLTVLGAETPHTKVPADSVSAEGRFLAHRVSFGGHKTHS